MEVHSVGAHPTHHTHSTPTTHHTHSTHTTHYTHPTHLTRHVGKWTVRVGSCNVPNMTDDTITYSETLKAARSQLVVVGSRVAALQGKLEEAQRRLSALNTLVQTLEQILGDRPESGSSTLVIPAAQGEGPADTSASQDVKQDSPTDEATPKRVPSTKWVATLVKDVGRPAKRDELFQMFVESKGIPDSWVSNPKNSFNNALGRAVEKHLILKLSPDLFAPRDYAGTDDLLDVEGP